MALPDTPAHSLRSVAGPPSRWLVGSVLRCKAWLLPRVTALTRTSERLPRCDGRKAVGRWLKTRVGGGGGGGGGGQPRTGQNGAQRRSQAAAGSHRLSRL